MAKPTYDELLKRGGGSGEKTGGRWADLVRSMSAGEVREVELRVGDNIYNVRINIRKAARVNDIPIATRKRGDKLYAVYLKPEDANGHK